MTDKDSNFNVLAPTIFSFYFVALYNAIAEESAAAIMDIYSQLRKISLS